MHDVACEFACAEGSAKTISANVFKESHIESAMLISTVPRDRSF